MSNYESKGIVKRVGETQTKGAKGFQTRAIVVELPDGKYPQTVEFVATGDRIGQLDQLRPGDEVAIKWNLRGREWNGNGNGPRVFNELSIWKLEVVGKAAPAGNVGGGPDDDIPFATCELAAEPIGIAKVLW